VFNRLEAPPPGAPPLPAPDLDEWSARARQWRSQLCAQPDLATQLSAFVLEKG
jgi:hypothetical protein